MWRGKDDRKGKKERRREGIEKEKERGVRGGKGKKEGIEGKRMRNR